MRDRKLAIQTAKTAFDGAIEELDALDALCDEEYEKVGPIIQLLIVHLILWVDEYEAEVMDNRRKLSRSGLLAKL